MNLETQTWPAKPEEKTKACPDQEKADPEVPSIVAMHPHHVLAHPPNQFIFGLPS